jgi:hypothetical protein
MRSRILPAVVLFVGFCAIGSGQQTSSPAGGQAAAGSGGGQGRRGGWGEPGQGRGILGTVTEAASDHFMVKTEAGELYTVHFSVNTRIVKAPERRRGEGGGQGSGQGGSQSEVERNPNPPQAIKASDIKVGDAITAGGEIDAAAKSVGAVFIALIDPERAKQMREMEANYGKTWLMGKVTAVDGVKVSLLGGPGNAAHSFVADENTTFRKRREPITLGDVQVGDSVRVEGGLKDGAFVATAVVVMGAPGAAGGPAPGTSPPN